MRQARWDSVVSLLPRDTAIVGVEVGVYQGKMSAALLSLLPNLDLHMVDRWTEYSVAERDGDPGGDMPTMGASMWPSVERAARAAVSQYAGRYRIQKGESVTIAKQFDNHSVDFVFIDADHSYEGCKADIQAWMPKVKRGGWLMGHDYPQRKGVREAVDEIFPKGVLKMPRRVWAVQL